MGNRIFVGSLSFNTNQDSLKQAFSRSGNVTEVKIVMDRETGRSRGFGFVTFASDDQASQAIQDWNGQELEGRRIVVNEAQDRNSDRTHRQFESGGSGGSAPRQNNGPSESRSGGGFGGPGGGPGGGGFGVSKRPGSQNVYRNQSSEGRPVQENRRDRGNRGNRRYDNHDE